MRALRSINRIVIKGILIVFTILDYTYFHQVLCLPQKRKIDFWSHGAMNDDGLIAVLAIY